MIYFQSLTKPMLAELLLPLSRDIKQASLRAKQIFNWAYQRHVLEWDQMTDLKLEIREWLKANVAIYRLKEKISKQALDGTHKFLWDLDDKKTIESVIIPAALKEKSLSGWDAFSGAPTDDDERELDSDSWRRMTVCISSQVGCAMACKFCLTGIQGMDRNLETHEIVTQVLETRLRAPITNIVFMGMGEPLNNLENVIKACQIFQDQDGLKFSKRKITVSTSGVVTHIKPLIEQTDVSLAVSLNATTDETRSAIMPVNKRWNIETLLDACRELDLGNHRRITFEYVLLKDFNDSLDDARRLTVLLKGIPSKINLIPFNEHSGSEFKRPSDERVRAFQKYLIDRKLTATVRISRGRDISAACGQLRSQLGTARGSDRHRDWA